MSSTPDFTSYTATVDFEGLKLPLPNVCRYITRDEFGFIQAWANRPTKNTEHGDFGDGEFTPITLGHQRGDNPVVMRKYRRSRSNCLI